MSDVKRVAIENTDLYYEYDERQTKLFDCDGRLIQGFWSDVPLRAVETYGYGYLLGHKAGYNEGYNQCETDFKSLVSSALGLDVKFREIEKQIESLKSDVDPRNFER